MIKERKRDDAGRVRAISQKNERQGSSLLLAGINRFFYGKSVIEKRSGIKNKLKGGDKDA